VFGYLFTKKWCASHYSGLIGAVGWGFNGMVLGRVVYQADFATLAWIPAVLFFLVSHRPILLGICVAMQWFAGFPPFFLLSLLGAMVVGCIDKDRKKSLTCLVQGSLIGLGLASIQIFPFIQMLSESGRGLLVNPGLALVNSVHPGDLWVPFLLPAPFQDLSPVSSHYMVGFFLGPVCLFLFGVGCVKGKKRERILAGMAFLSLILAMGKYNGFYPFIPFLRIFRYPLKIQVIQKGR